MRLKKLVLGAAAYTVCTFLLAVVWHLLLFKERYESFGYFEGEPGILAGLLAVVLQGFLLSALFAMLKPAGTGIYRGLSFSLVAGAFFWTSHVLAFVAKQEVPGVSAFVWMESVYLLIQFGLFGLVLGAIHREPKPA